MDSPETGTPGSRFSPTRYETDRSRIGSRCRIISSPSAIALRSSRKPSAGKKLLGLPAGCTTSANAPGPSRPISAASASAAATTRALVPGSRSKPFRRHPLCRPHACLRDRRAPCRARRRIGPRRALASPAGQRAGMAGTNRAAPEGGAATHRKHTSASGPWSAGLHVNPFSMRMLFSSLVDADFSQPSAFMQG